MLQVRAVVWDNVYMGRLIGVTLVLGVYFWLTSTSSIPVCCSISCSAVESCTTTCGLHKLSANMASTKDKGKIVAAHCCTALNRLPVYFSAVAWAAPRATLRSASSVSQTLHLGHTFRGAKRGARDGWKIDWKSKAVQREGLRSCTSGYINMGVNWKRCHSTWLPRAVCLHHYKQDTITIMATC